MVNDVTTRGEFRERFQTTLFPVSTEGRGVHILLLKEFTTSRSFPDFRSWMYDWGLPWALKVVFEGFWTTGEKTRRYFFPRSPLKTSLDSTEYASRWACPLFELKHKTQPLSFVRTEDYIATAGFSFLFIEKERMYRNFGSQERGNPPYTGTSGTNPASLGNTSTSATHQEQVGVLSLTELGKRLGVK